MVFIKRNAIIILVTIVISLITISFVILQFIKPTEKQIPVVPQITTTPTQIYQITPTPTVEEGYKGIKQSIDPETQQKAEQQLKATQLINKLPYKGKDFSLSYNIKTNTFVIKLGSNLPAANQEIDAYLKSQGILDRSWLGNITYE